MRDLALLFLKLGTIAFGGPAAHIAMMEDEVVTRRKWLTSEEFLDFLGATNLIPGPNSTEMAIHVGKKQAGWAGLVIAGTCFILPAAFIVSGLAWAYVRYGSIPEATALLYGVKPVVISIVLQALWRLARSAVRTARAAAIGIAAAAIAAAGINELWILALAAGLMALLHRIRNGRRPQRAAVSRILVGLWPSGALAAVRTGSAGATFAMASAPFGLGQLFLVFLKVGALLFGSGYVLLAFLRTDLVERLGWLTEGQLLDAVAIGQITPGPVFTTATFIGYILGGWAGAFVATVGIFLPAFIFVALSGPLVPRIRRSPTASAALDGVVVASLALMAVVTWQLGRAAFVDAPTVLLAVISAVLLIRFRVNSAWLVFGGGVAGLLLHA